MQVEYAGSDEVVELTTGQSNKVLGQTLGQPTEGTFQEPSRYNQPTTVLADIPGTSEGRLHRYCPRPHLGGVALGEKMLWGRYHG